jgi:phage terminase Nu1 subunit (DNA packaging protein)
MKSSISQLSEITGIDRRTISRRLQPLEPEITGRSHLYETVTALPLIYGHMAEDGSLDLSQERAALARAQRELTELKTAQQQNELVPAAEVEKQAHAAATTVRDTFLALPGRVAGQMVGLTDQEVELLLAGEVRQALRSASAIIEAADAPQAGPV